MSVQQFWNSLSYWGYLLAVNSQIYVKTSSLRHANNVPKLPGVDYVAKKMLKALPLVHIWSVLLLKEQMMTSVRKTLKPLVWSVQNRLISSEICPENNHKIRHVLPIKYCFLAKFALKIPAKSADFSAILSLKIPPNLTIFSTIYQKPCIISNLGICFQQRMSTGSGIFSLAFKFPARHYQ